MEFRMTRFPAWTALVGLRRRRIGAAMTDPGSAALFRAGNSA